MATDDDLENLNCYSMGQVVTMLHDLRNLIGGRLDSYPRVALNAGARCNASVKEKEILVYLAASTRGLIEGRDEGFVNNIRGLQHLRFLSPDEAELAIGMGAKPDPIKDFDDLIRLARAFAGRLPLYKDNLTC